MAARFFSAAVICLLSLGVSTLDTDNSINELELQSLRQQRELLQQKLILLEESRQSLVDLADPATDTVSEERIQKLITETARTFEQEQTQEIEEFNKVLKKSKKDRSMAKVMLGERKQLEFRSPETDEPIEIVDYFYLSTIPINEAGPQAKGQQMTKDMVVVLLADNSFVIASMETGKLYLWQELDLSELDENDSIVDMQPSKLGTEPFFIILTRRGKLLLHHYAVVDTPNSFSKYSMHLKKYDKDVKGICRDRLRPEFTQACLAKETQQHQATAHDGIFFAITEVEIIDLPTMIKNETKVTIGEPLTDDVEFNRIQIVRHKGNFFFVIADTAGHISTLLKNLRLKSRISAEGTIKDLQSQQNHLIMLHENYVSFSHLIDNAIAPFYCEGSFTNEFSFTQVEVEKYRTQALALYALNSNREVIIYEYKYTVNSSGSHDNNYCKQMARFTIPEDFSKGRQVSLVSVRGSIMLVSQDGHILLVESTNESLLQTPSSYLYRPSTFPAEIAVEEGEHESGSLIKVIETKAPERNSYLVSQSTQKISGSYVTMRVPGSLTRLATLEFDSNAIAGEVKELDESSQWLSSMIQPTIFLVFIGLACYVSYSSVQKRANSKRGVPSKHLPQMPAMARKGFGGSRRR